MALDPAGTSIYFYYCDVFNCLGVPQVPWKINYIKYKKLKEYPKLFSVIYSGIFLQAALLPSGNQLKNNNHRLRRFKEQFLP